MKKYKLRNVNLLLSGVICGSLLAACNGGSSSGSSTSTITPPNTANSTLAEYKSMLAYTTLTNQQSIEKTTTNNQQSFTLNGDTTFSSIDMELFNNSNCSSNNAGLQATITLNGGTNGIIFPAGTYTSTGASNYALCSKLSTGCAGLYAAFENNTIKSVRFNYNYANTSGGPGTITSTCMGGSSDNSNKETLLDWSSGSPTACTKNSTNCGFSKSYSVSLPATFVSTVTPTPTPDVTVTPEATTTPVVETTPTPIVTEVPIITPTLAPTPEVTVTPVETSTPAITVTQVTNLAMIGTNNSYQFTVTIKNGSSTITPTITSSNSNANISPTSCSLNSSVLGSGSCVFTVTNHVSSWNTANVNNSTNVDTQGSVLINSGISLSINADSEATINGKSSPLTINNISETALTPYIYLPAPQTYNVGRHEGCWKYLPMRYCVLKDYSESTSGITWSGGNYIYGVQITYNPIYDVDSSGVVNSGGTINPRYSTGKQSNGTACESTQEVEVDNLTGLMWVKWPSKTEYALKDAQTAPAIPKSYCGYTDWRLPTINEMLSLVNYGMAKDGINGAMWLNSYGFNQAQPLDYWTSTPTSDATYNWVVSLSSGHTFSWPGHNNGTGNPLVWPVRGGQ